MRSSSIGRTPMSLGRDPVARMTCAARYFSRLPSAASTSTPPPPKRRPRPSTWMTLFFLKRWPTPFASCSAIALLRS